jgi:alpha-glucan,water dikinase
MQPVATKIGVGCTVQSWVVEILSEEIVRAGPAFAVSLVLSRVGAVQTCATR